MIETPYSLDQLNAPFYLTCYRDFIDIPKGSNVVLSINGNQRLAVYNGYIEEDGKIFPRFKTESREGVLEYEVFQPNIITRKNGLVNIDNTNTTILVSIQ